jgi:hypothetical protein
MREMRNTNKILLENVKGRDYMDISLDRRVTLIDFKEIG